jgi:Insertion element 4 transposase N-terminal/Transposase DDE domain
MARTRKALPAKVDVAHLISTGVLASVCPRALIDEVLQETGRGSQRTRLLPAPAVVYYVMALALWREAPLEEVLRVVCEGLQWLGGGQAEAVQASKSAISQARTRLGPEVMQRLAQRVLRPLAPPGAPGCWYRGLRVMALDGSCMDVADERANAEFFGYPTATRGQSAFPQARLLGLIECGTHVIVAALIAAYARSEKAMAADALPGWLRKDMLVMADRGFYSFKLWAIACDSGAALLWRVSSTIKLPVQQALPDGSYLSTVFDSEDTARRRGRTVRVIEYTLHESAVPTQDSYRLITTLLDPKQAPGQELALLYHERWEIEGVFDEFKTHLRASSTVLRSKTPELVQQELWGLLLAHFAIRQLMAQAAWPRALDPDRLSFTHAVRVIKRKMPQAAAVPP